MAEREADIEDGWGDDTWGGGGKYMVHRNWAGTSINRLFHTAYKLAQLT